MNSAGLSLRILDSGRSVLTASFQQREHLLTNERIHSMVATAGIFASRSSLSKPFARLPAGGVRTHFLRGMCFTRLRAGGGVMSNGDHYTSLLEELGDKREWALFHLLAKEPLGARTSILADWFLVACRQQDDDRAKEYFDLVMKGFEDVYVRPLAEEGRSGWLGHGNRKCLILPHSKQKEIRAAENLMGYEKAAYAMKQYPNLPDSESTHTVEYIVQDETERVRSTGRATLLKTRAAILEVIATRWRNTEDENEADSLFEFLWNLETGWQEREARYDAMKDATDRCFPVARLERHIVTYLDPRTDYRSEEKNIPALLAAAWTRSQEGIARVAMGARVTRALSGATGAAFALAEIIAMHAREIDDEVVALARLLGFTVEKNPYSGLWRRTPAGLDIFYPYFGSVILTIKVRDDIGIRGRLDEEALHDRFGKYKAIVETWWSARANSQIKGLTLRFERHPYRYERSDEKPYFTREVHFGTHV